MIAQIPETDEIREVFRRELSGPEYVVVDESVLARGLRALRELLADLFEWAFPGGVEAGPAPWIPWVLVLGGAALLFLLVRAIRGRARSGRTAAPVGAAAPSTMGAREWEAWADARAAEGDFDAAATGYYQAGLRRLHEAGAVEFGEWKTPGDYVQEVDPAWDGREDFVSFVSDFVSTAFGTGGPGAASVARLAERQRSLGART